MIDNPHIDVVILGGGLSGLTLALQLKQANPDLRISVLEKRQGDAPAATHKIGESVVELGSHYLKDVLGLERYLLAHHVLKRGFRFFFSPEEKEDFSRRVEMGSDEQHPFPAFQVDRGLLENELCKLVQEQGISLYQGAAVETVDIRGKNQHELTFIQNGLSHRLQASWVIDACGRRSLLKRSLDLTMPIDHAVNAAWFRIKATIDIDDWSDNPNWKHTYPPNHRRLATNHLMGKGYWVWIIPLSSGYTSVGIVADPAFHPFEDLLSIEKVMSWLKIEEPIAHQMLLPLQDQIADFRSFKQLAHDAKQFYSADRWGLTGDAGAFLDPFYSPGTDFIGLSNTWLSDLIVRERAGEAIGLRAKIYNHVHRELLQSWGSLYTGMYGLFGSTQVMLYKTIWDWCSYWAIPCLMFMNKGYTDLSVLKQYSGTKLNLGTRFSKLNENMQRLFLAWQERGVPPCSNQTLNYFDLSCIRELHDGLKVAHPPQQLIAHIQVNIQLLEQIAAGLFRLVSWHCHGSSLQSTVDPYVMDLSDPHTAFTSPNALEVNEDTHNDLTKAWFMSEPIPMNAYVS